MKNFIHIILAIFLILITFANTYGIEVGDKAPNLIGYNAIGEARLNLYRLMTKMIFKKDENGQLIKKNGKFEKEFTNYVMVLNFYSKTCIPCLKEIPTYNKTATKFKGKKVKFLYINVDPNPTKAQIEKFRGQLNIESSKDKGTKFTISLPLTLAIIDGMLVRVDDERYVIPTISVQKAFKPGKEDYFTVEAV